MDKKICICVIGSGFIGNAKLYEMIEKYGKKHNVPEVMIISDDEFKNPTFNKEREQIKLNSELILKSIKYEDLEPKELFPEEVKYTRQQNKLRERNFRPNFKYRK